MLIKLRSSLRLIVFALIANLGMAGFSYAEKADRSLPRYTVEKETAHE